jgi:hypothetical protein
MTFCRRSGQWRRETVATAVAGALLLVVAMASLSGIRSSQKTDADLISLAANWATRSHRQVMASAKKMHNAALAPSRLSSLTEYMKDKSPHDFPLLAASEVKRAMACPHNSISGSFEGDSTVSMYTHVEEYDPVKEVKHGDTQLKTDLKVWLDVFETNHMGCIHGHVAYGINITKVQTSPAEVHEHSDDKGNVDKKFEGQLSSDGENEMMMRALTANAITFVQDSATGHYADFVFPGHELSEVVNTKRSLVNGLNPVINIANRDKAMRREDGSLLFQMAFRGMNGFQRTDYSIKHTIRRRRARTKSNTTPS